MSEQPRKVDPAFEKALKETSALVETFRLHRAHYLSGTYQEADARKDFIDKFWIILGWDVNHEVQTNPYQQEVKVERNPSGEFARGRRADYAFLARNFRDVRFFVEAKRPGSSIDTANDCFQVTRYGWSSHASLSVLMNFEQFRVLDCRYKPDPDSATQAIIQSLAFHYTQYSDPESFRLIYYLFARDHVLQGSIERFVEALPKQTGRARQTGLFRSGRLIPVDDAFLQELDAHRAELARSFKKENPSLNSDALTELTQRTLDRFVFMRFLEDKLIEHDAIVDELGHRGSVWNDFIRESRRLDGIYNGIIFKEHDLLDSPRFRVDEEVLKRLRDELAHTNSPYAFHYVPIHILGSIYERFLGNVIVATAKQARLEPKPEVRKAGGVYYTPEYIVRYIVEKTIGKLIEGKTPEEIRQMRFADIACGSGSFLLGVYDCLLRYHALYFNKIPRRIALKAGCVEGEDGKLHLSLKQKREILQNNIYGVDIDQQAVEVAQLSLFLKLLEEENATSARLYQHEFGQRLLPDLSKNIVCGNSLIGWDINGSLFGATEEEKKLNPMDFEAAFPGIMRDGGFDSVVGNPPYRMLQPHNTNEKTLQYLREHYVRAEFKIEFFHLFLQRAVTVTKNSGMVGYIVPATLLNNVYAESLRSWLLTQCNIESIAVANEKVFLDADVHPLVATLRRNSPPDPKHEILTTTALNEHTAEHVTFNRTKQIWFSLLPGNVWNVLVNNQNAPLITRLLHNFTPLEKMGTLNRGLITGDRDKYFSTSNLNKKYVEIVSGADVQRYFVSRPSEFVLFERPETAGGCWDAAVHFAPHKLAIRQIGERPMAAFIDRPLAVTGNIFTFIGSSPEEEKYILAIFNSRLIHFFWTVMFTDFKTSFPQVTLFSLSLVPIKEPEKQSSEFGSMVKLVQQIAEAKLRLATAMTDRERGRLENKCAALDRQIDQLVYQLYELQPEEIALVESSTPRTSEPRRRERAIANSLF